MIGLTHGNLFLATFAWQPKTLHWNRIERNMVKIGGGGGRGGAKIAEIIVLLPVGEDNVKLHY